MCVCSTLLTCITDPPVHNRFSLSLSSLTIEAPLLSCPRGHGDTTPRRGATSAQGAFFSFFSNGKLAGEWDHSFLLSSHSGFYLISVFFCFNLVDFCPFAHLFRVAAASGVEWLQVYLRPLSDRPFDASFLCFLCFWTDSPPFLEAPFWIDFLLTARL